MKGITIIIILSVVWSIIAGIIEKKKAAAKRAAMTPGQPSVPTKWKADPVKVKIESLRRRKKSRQEAPVPQPTPPREHVPIKPLHVEDCPLPPTKSRLRSSNAASRQLAAMLHNKRNIRTAIVLNEILSKPVSQRI